MQKVFKNVYEGVCPHKLSVDQTKQLVITLDMNYAQTEKNQCAVPADLNALLNTIDFYSKEFSTRQRFVAVEENMIKDVLSKAFYSGTNIIRYDKNDIIYTKKMPKLDFCLLKVRYSNKPHPALGIVCSMLAEQIPVDLTLDDAVSLVMSANESLDSNMVKKTIEGRINEIKKMVTRIKSISAEKVTVTSLEGLAAKILKNPGVAIIKTPTASGKTSAVIEPIIRHGIEKGLVPVYVTHRRSIVSSSMMFDGVTHYEQIQAGTEDEILALKIVVNSTVKTNLNGTFERSKILCVDEAKQTLNHLFEGTVKDPKGTYEQMLDMIRDADTVIMTDADANDRLVQMVMNTGRTDITIYEMKADHSDITMNITDADSVHSMIRAAITTGQRAFVAFDNKQHADELSEGIKKDFEKKSVLTITGDSINGNEQQAFLANPNVVGRTYDVVIYSPVITSSVSITKDVFAANFGVFSGVITPMDAVQMLRRDRTATEFTVGLSKSKHLDYQNNNAERIATGQEFLTGEKSTEFDLLAAGLLADSTELKNLFVPAFVYNCEIDGFEINVMRTDKDFQKGARTTRKRYSAIEAANYIQQILIASPMSPREVMKAQNEQELDQNTPFRVQRYEMERSLVKADITHKDIDLYSRGRLNVILNNIEIARMSVQTCKTLDDKDTNKALSSRTHFETKNYFFNMILEVLEIDLERSTGEFMNDKAVALLNKMHEKRDLWNPLSIMPATYKWSDSTSACRIVNILLEKVFGIKTESKSTSAKYGRQRKYAIKSARANDIFEVIIRREQARKEKIVRTYNAEIIDPLN